MQLSEHHVGSLRLAQTSSPTASVPGSGARRVSSLRFVAPAAWTGEKMEARARVLFSQFMNKKNLPDSHALCTKKQNKENKTKTHRSEYLC